MSLLVDHEPYLRLVATMVLHERVPHRAISPPDRSPVLTERPARPSSSPVLIVEQSVCQRSNPHQMDRWSRHLDTVSMSRITRDPNSLWAPP